MEYYKIKISFQFQWCEKVTTTIEVIDNYTYLPNEIFKDMDDHYRSEIVTEAYEISEKTKLDARICNILTRAEEYVDFLISNNYLPHNYDIKPKNNRAISTHWSNRSWYVAK